MNFFKSIKLTPFVMFVSLLITFAMIMIGLHNKTIEKSEQLYSELIALQTQDLKDSIEFTVTNSLYYDNFEYLETYLDNTVQEHKEYLKITIKDKNNKVLVASSANIDDRSYVTRSELLGDGKYILEAFITESKSINAGFSKDFGMYQIIAIVLTIITIILYTLIGQYNNKLLTDQIKRLEKEKDEEVIQHKEKSNMLLHQSKLALMGEMISNIAHQWRQPLNSISLIMNNLAIAKEFGNLDDKEFIESKEKVDKNLQFMSNTINDFRNFYKPNKEKEIFSLTQGVDLATSIVEASFESRNIELDIYIQEDQQLLGHLNEFSQVLVTLLENSRDAIKSRLTLNPKVEISVHKAAYHATIVVRDNAGGLDGDIIDRIFEPYFTTKSKGQGTGLGLYIAKMIVESMDGEMSASNSKDGLEFTFTIPTVSNPPQSNL